MLQAMLLQNESTFSWLKKIVKVLLVLLLIVYQILILRGLQHNLERHECCLWKKAKGLLQIEILVG